MLTILPLYGIGEVEFGADLAAILAAAIARTGATIGRQDILVVTQKVVSKAEGRFADMAHVPIGEQAARLAAITRKDARFVQLVLDESSDIVRAAPNVLIARHHSGHVMANAGIDRSNLGPGHHDDVLLLPVNADRSAAALHQGLGHHFVDPPAIVISDSFGRPWRYGVTCVAIGAAGLPALVDRRGERDRDGRLLEVTQVAFADLAASAAGLVTGEGAEGVPAALIRGLNWDAPDRPAASIVRPVVEDLFR
jgi:coenzyme F420-0:L-glutamate ligase/coenzyme F420-1:gamma-L-glutamate ligase